MIVYNYDANLIWGQTIKNQTAPTFTEEWLHFQQLIAKSSKAQHYIMNNEINNDLKGAIQTEEMTLELTPPNIHRQNAAEQAI